MHITVDGAWRVKVKMARTFRQIFLSGNGAPANIAYHRRNADTAAFRQISSDRGPVYYDLPKC